MQQKTLLTLLFTLVLSAGEQSAIARSRAHHAEDRAGIFDHYTLSLSWAPSYCASHPQDRAECGTGKRYGFLLHGLWPQYASGGWPESCSRQALPDNTRERFSALYPSSGLMQHEWSRHGTCSDLSPDGYFMLAQTLHHAIRIPEAYRTPASPFRTTREQLTKDFLIANPSLKPAGLLPQCKGNYLTELHICYDRTGSRPATCSPRELSRSIKSCGAPFTVRAVR